MPCQYRLLQFLAVDAGLRAGLEYASAEAPFLRELFSFGPAHAQAAGIHASRRQQLGERFAGGPR